MRYPSTLGNSTYTQGIPEHVREFFTQGIPEHVRGVYTQGIPEHVRAYVIRLIEGRTDGFVVIVDVISGGFHGAMA